MGGEKVDKKRKGKNAGDSAWMRFRLLKINNFVRNFLSLTLCHSSNDFLFALPAFPEFEVQGRREKKGEKERGRGEMEREI